MREIPVQEELAKLVEAVEEMRLSLETTDWCGQTLRFAIAHSLDDPNGEVIWAVADRELRKINESIKSGTPLGIKMLIEKVLRRAVEIIDKKGTV